MLDPYLSQPKGLSNYPVTSPPSLAHGRGSTRRVGVRAYPSIRSSVASGRFQPVTLR